MAVFRRGKVWWYDFRHRGIRVRETARATTRAEALQVEAIRKAELTLGQARIRRPQPPPRFADFANKEFCHWCANEHRECSSTYARYMRSVKALSEFFEAKTLDMIDSGSVEKFKIFRRQQRRKNARDGRLVSAAAVNRDLAVLRILFKYAIRVGKTAHNPVKGVKFLREEEEYMRVLTPEEEAAYLRAASPLLKDVAIIMLETGMRPGEVCQLQVADLDLGQKSVCVRRGKTVYARRHIPLTRRALCVLAKRVEAATKEWLFPCPYDVSRPVGEVRKAHEAAVRRSGIQPRFRLYDLRHTALSRMAMSGMDLPTLKEVAGHSQIQMTMRYVHPTPDHKRRAFNRFELSVSALQL